MGHAHRLAIPKELKPAASATSAPGTGCSVHLSANVPASLRTRKSRPAKLLPNGVVLGHAELALLDLPAHDRARPNVEHIRAAGVRAAELTAQMLAYSGRGRLVVGPLDLAALVREMNLLVRASVPQGVALDYALETELPAVEADAAQLHQAVANLVINVAEALGGQAGCILVCLGRQRVTQADLAGCYLSPELPSGDYLALEVADTGSGMDEATQQRIFEPFFTTKCMGRGLGLSAVFGIVRAHQGAIQVTSAPGQGTTITLLLPALAPADDEVGDTRSAIAATRHNTANGSGDRR